MRLSKEEWRTLAEIGAFHALGMHRRAALWAVEELYREDDLFSAAVTKRPAAQPLAAARDGCFRAHPADYAGTSVVLGKHPMALLRARVPDAWRAVDLARAADGLRVRIAGNVICRQRPGTAKGVVFISLEDETGISNAIVQPWLFEQERLLITEEDYLVIEGRLQAREGTLIVQAEKIEPLDSRRVRRRRSRTIFTKARDSVPAFWLVSSAAMTLRSPHADAAGSKEFPAWRRSTCVRAWPCFAAWRLCRAGRCRRKSCWRLRSNAGR